MELGLNHIIKGFVLTPKSLELHKKLGKATISVHAKANKNEIKSAVEKIWDVKVDNVRVINTLGKRRRFAGKISKLADKKKAIITLEKGYKIDLPGQFADVVTSAGMDIKE